MRVLSYFTSAVSSISAISIIVVGSCVQNADTALLVCGLSGSVAGMTQTLMSQFADRMKANNQEDVRAALHDTNIEALDLEFQGIIINEVSAHVAELRTVLAESPV
ncbi:MAG: hypothetical protein LBB14_00480 [Puniceicoccales bacterium]|nr:hypothetical protein [Puniceicoccales bacterium]